MKIFAQCEEFRAMWRLADEMIEKGFHTTAQTFNILICTCSEAGLAMNVLERFIKSKTFNFRLYKSSYNAILHSLLVLRWGRHLSFIDCLMKCLVMEFFEIFIPITSFYMFMERQTIHLLHLNAMKEAGELEKAQEMFEDMIVNGQSPMHLLIIL
ncbi:hypothetical protein Peur_072963 [Populus x canadensis]